MAGDMNTFVLDWNGDKVSERTIVATQLSMDRLMADCVTTAKYRVPRKTSILQGSIQMRPTVRSGTQLTGFWGSFSVKYARWVEEGTAPHLIFPRKAQALYWKGAAHPVRMVNHPGTKARPYLVPTADEKYPSLPLRIRAELEWGAK
jgi:hypothetical protein